MDKGRERAEAEKRSSSEAAFCTHYGLVPLPEVAFNGVPSTGGLRSGRAGRTATDFQTFAAVLLLFAAVAFFSTYIPARRAARIDPTVAFRYE
jgi:hypothetical protein